MGMMAEESPCLSRSSMLCYRYGEEAEEYLCGRAQRAGESASPAVEAQGRALWSRDKQGPGR
jgi:hypothetical protein